MAVSMVLAILGAAVMLLMTLCVWAYSFAVVFARARALVLEQEYDTDWVKTLTSARSAHG